MTPTRSRGPVPTRRDFFRSACAAGVLAVGPPGAAAAGPAPRFLCGNLPRTGRPFDLGRGSALPPAAPIVPRAVVDLNRVWPAGATITAYLLNGTTHPCLPLFYDRIVQGAGVWERYANVLFDFKLGPPPPPARDENVITVNCLLFGNEFGGGGEGSFNSRLGTDARKYRHLTPTLNLIFPPAWLVSLPDPVLTRAFDSAVLHEFGHALGFGHEHQRPDRPFDLAPKPQLYAAALRAWGWGPEMVESQLVAFFPGGTTATAFDVKSVMIYPIPEGIAVYKDGPQQGQPFVTDDIAELSPFDKVAAVWAYPAADETFTRPATVDPTGSPVEGRISREGRVAIFDVSPTTSGPHELVIGGAMPALVSVSTSFRNATDRTESVFIIAAGESDGTGPRPVLVNLRVPVTYRVEVRHALPRQLPAAGKDTFTVAVRPKP